MTTTTAEDTLNQILQRILDGIDTTVAFGADQLPDVIQQLLAWHAIESLIWCALSLTLLGLWIALTHAFFRKGGWAYHPHHKDEVDEHAAGAYAMTTIVLTIGIVAAADLDWLKIWLAPKLYLLEYGASLVK